MELRGLALIYSDILAGELELHYANSVLKSSTTIGKKFDHL
jgi:hypothetical protein